MKTEFTKEEMDILGRMGNDPALRQEHADLLGRLQIKIVDKYPNLVAKYFNGFTGGSFSGSPISYEPKADTNLEKKFSFTSVNSTDDYSQSKGMECPFCQTRVSEGASECPKCKNKI